MEACCSPGCMGQECVHARTLLRRLADELMLLDGRVGSLLQKDHRPSTEVSLPLAVHQSPVFFATWPSPNTIYI